jgi:Fe-S-cluster containining protein
MIGSSPLEGESAVSDDSICIGCGMCCDGTLYGNTRVKEQDEAAVAAVNLNVVEVNGKRVFLQPCPHFSCGKCGIYEQRPPVCQGYRCNLLKSLDEGRVTEAEAREKIARAKEFINAVRRMKNDAITPGQRVELSKSLQSQLVDADENERRRIAAKLLEIGALDLFLTRWFHKKKSGEAATEETNG